MSAVILHESDATPQCLCLRFRRPSYLAVQAPGRVKPIGKQTDYNDGFVLPCAINYRDVICGRRVTTDSNVQCGLVGREFNARHIITDSRRALDLAAALPKGDIRRSGQLMADSPRTGLQASIYVYHPSAGATVLTGVTSAQS